MRDGRLYCHDHCPPQLTDHEQAQLGIHGWLPRNRRARVSTITFRRKYVAWGAAVAILIGIIAIAGAVNQGSGQHSNDRSEATKFIAKIDQNANATSADTNHLLAEMRSMANSADADLYQVAADAKALHDHLSDWRHDMFTEVNVDNDRQYALFNAENELKNAAGSIQSWTSDLDPSKTADVAAQLRQAVTDWNAAVRAIWSRGRQSNPPTIRLDG